MSFINSCGPKYTVKPGDSLSKISATCYGTQDFWFAIAKENGIKDPYIIYPKQVLKIPSNPAG
ncbi:MAG: LysM peptidoglycan-binding domain-containing protein [Moorea sp. SIO3E2]|uniref:LysM peptidoglycan-binding domain-containing protein n=1 Tax=Moorena sp. SIO4E2 TaxID=2607826 RepID=UPI0013BD9FF6|nr:LysM peptidoglycan-binding domain-containing protein [Moorena sp. SIO4E2]NEQ13846.1 LysM peptidoglycan-binding domain-containing protein [Moorena sp. SIO3E2]